MVIQTIGIRTRSGEAQIFRVQGEYDLDELRLIVKDEVPDANPILIRVMSTKVDSV